MHIICHKAPTISCQTLLVFLGFTAKKLYIIHGHILSRVVKLGYDILELFKNPYDFPQPVILCNRPVSQIFVIFCVSLKREIVNDVLQRTWEEATVDYVKEQCKCLTRTPKEYNVNFQ
jgi:hypothetical protein